MTWIGFFSQSVDPARLMGDLCVPMRRKGGRTDDDAAFGRDCLAGRGGIARCRGALGCVVVPEENNGCGRCLKLLQRLGC